MISAKNILEEQIICDPLRGKKMRKLCNKFSKMDRENAFKAYGILSSVQLKKENLLPDTGYLAK